MTRMNKVLRVLLPAFALALTPVAQSWAQTTAPRPKEIVLAAPRDLAPGPKDPYYTNPILYVWEPLVINGENGEPAPQLATSWSLSEDAKTWTLKLREGVRFHDGEPFNADAVIANFDRYRKISPKASPFTTFSIDQTFPGLTKVEKVETHTIRLVFSQPQPMLIYAMVGFGSPIYSPKNFEANGDFKGFPQGTGPFKLVEHRPDVSLLLQRNDDYHGAKAGAEFVRVRTIPAPDTRLSAMKAGEILGVMDLGAIPPEQANELAKDNRFALSWEKSTISHYLHPNGKSGIFKDVRLRQAVSMAIDREAIVKGLYRGYPSPTVNILNFTSPFMKTIAIPHDPKRAAALASEALAGKRAKILMIVPSYGIDRYPYKAQAELIQATLIPLGLDAEIRILDAAAYRKAQTEGEYDLALATQGLPNSDPFTLLNNYLATKGSSNALYSFGYSNPRVDQLLQEASVAVDIKQRRKAYEELQDLALQDMPTIPLFNDTSLIAYNKQITGYRATVYGTTLPEVRWAQ